MSRLPVLKTPNEKLRTLSAPVAISDITSKKIQILIDNLLETMKKENGVGLAAPQVGENLRIIIAEHDGAPEVLVNPALRLLSWSKINSEEGCLSVPDVYGIVRRHRSGTLSAYDRSGNPISAHVNGFFAIVLQHEIDHLDGILFTDRVTRYTDRPERKI